MVKKFIILIAVAAGAAVLGGLFLQTTLAAEDQFPLSQAHKDRIIANCTSARASLQQLHRSDASLRVNRGQLYEFISTKLMARLNSRLALNRLNAAELVAATAQYEKTLGEFRDAYRTYEEQLKAALRVDCTKQPEQFYYQVVDARTKREEISAVTARLSQCIDEYHRAFERFSTEYRSAVNGVVGD